MPPSSLAYFHFKDISKMKPTNLLNKIIAHQLSMEIKRDPSTSNQEASA
jgi:hypothetical protein